MLMPVLTPSPHRRRLALTATAAVLTLGASALIAPAAQAADPVDGAVTIDLVTVNDFHGRIEASGAAGGIAALATAVNGIRATNANTVFAAAGDMIGASTFTSFIQQDVPTIETLNAAGLDVSAAGNHEFDKGWLDLRDRVLPLAEWEYISANVWDTETDDYALAPYWTQTFEGVTVGFIGAVTEELPALVSPAGIATLDVNPVVDSVNAVAAQLSDGDTANDEADVLVLLVHEGASQPTLESATDLSTPFGKIVAGVTPDVDAIVSGHTHQAYNLVVDDRPVISSGQYGEKFSDMQIVVNADKSIRSMVNTTYSMTTGTGSSSDPYVPVYTPGTAEQPIVDLVAESVAYAKVAGAVKVGNITDSFQRGLQPRTPTPTDPTTVQEARGAESTLGNFVADVQLDQIQVRFPETQIAFMNPGGLRADLKYPSSSGEDPDGNVTYAEAAGVQPFANTLVTTTLTGAQVKGALEEQWQPTTASRPFLKLGVSEGLTYITDYSAENGSHITQLELNGEPIDPAASYKVVVNAFLAAGGDNFPSLDKGQNEADSGIVDLEAMVAWFATNGEATPDLTQRSIGVSLSAPSGSAYDTGETIDVDLSSLDFTQTSTHATTATVAIGGVEVGTAPINTDLVALTDEAGTASLSVVVPAGIEGTVPLTITTDTGTSFEVPIEVVVPIKTQVKAKVEGGKKGEPASLEVSVKGKGSPAAGEVTVSIDGYAPIQATLTDGAATIALPDLPRGTYTADVSYAGADGWLASETTVKVKIK
jgi:5'-nucleotidase